MKNQKYKLNNKKIKQKEFKLRLYNFVLKLIKLIENLPKDNISNRIGDQLIRSGCSILSNYIEGLSGSSKKDFTNYLNNSLKSTNESKVWLSILKDTKRSDLKTTNKLLNDLDEFSKIFASSILTLKGKR